ncbi:MAG: AI-2E family transporter [Chitinophagaceae bacterium]
MAFVFIPETSNIMTTSNSIPFYAKLALCLLALVLLGAIIYAGSSILMPICFAILLAMLLLPVVNWLTRKGVPGVPAMLLSILLALLFAGGIIYFLSSQVADFMSDLPAIKEKLNQHLSTAQDWISHHLNINKKQQATAAENVKENMQSGSGGMGTALVSVASGLAMLILLPIYTFLILFYRKLIHKFLVDVFPNRHESRVEEVLTESKTIVQGYMIGLIIEMAIVTALNTAGFLIIGIQYAVFLAVFAAVLNLIPYIGMLIASIICMAVTLTTSDSLNDILWVGVVLIVVQFIDNNFIMPYIVSSKVRINALVSIIGVLIGGGLAGISGMFLSIPVIAVLKAIFDRVDGLKPWGDLLGDDLSLVTTKKRKGRIKKER